MCGVSILRFLFAEDALTVRALTEAARFPVVFVADMPNARDVRMGVLRSSGSEASFQ